jgi:hypothetical protein
MEWTWRLMELRKHPELANQDDLLALTGKTDSCDPEKIKDLVDNVLLGLCDTNLAYQNYTRNLINMEK